jgi:hypothetical protein
MIVERAFRSDAAALHQRFQARPTDIPGFLWIAVLAHPGKGRQQELWFRRGIHLPGPLHETGTHEFAPREARPVTISTETSTQGMQTQPAESCNNSAVLLASQNKHFGEFFVVSLPRVNS